MEINLLRNLGLNEYESKAYIALIRYGTLTAKDVAKKSGVPQTAIYPNLKTLAEKGLISLKAKEPLTYEAVDPMIGIRSYREFREEELEAFEQEALNSIMIIQKTEAVEKEEDFLHILKGWNQSAATLKDLIAESKKEVLLMSGMTRKTAFMVIHALKDALKRGVKIRFIIVQKPGDNKEVLKEFMKLGVEMKYHPMKSFAIEVKDAKESVIVLRNPELKDRIILRMENEDLAKAHRDYFYTVWEKAEELKLK